MQQLLQFLDNSPPAFPVLACQSNGIQFIPNAINPGSLFLLRSKKHLACLHLAAWVRCMYMLPVHFPDYITCTYTAQAKGDHAVCGQKTFTTVEDRAVEKDVIERVIEHHPVEKKYVVETRPAGEHELHDKRQVSHLS